MCQHHWYINSQEQGQCLKCGVERTFTKDMDKADGLNGKAYKTYMANMKSSGSHEFTYELFQQGALPPQIKIAAISPQEKHGLLF